MGPENIVGRRSGFAGTLGWGALIGHRLSIDYANGMVAFSQDPLPAAIQPCKSRVVIDFVSPTHMPGLILLEGKWEGRPVLAQLDTGKSSTVFDPDVIEPSTLADQDISIGPFKVPTRHARFRSLAGFNPQQGLPVLMGLGSDFLTRFLVTIDYPGQKVVLESRTCV
jgi:hypothetical protein